MKTKLFAAMLATGLMLISCSKEETISNPKHNVEKATATIAAGTVQQSINGFGGANIVGWTGDLTADQRTKAFSASSGIGLSIVRVRISPNTADWAAEKATIDACKSNGGIAIATCWSAPASMKTNNSTIAGDLKTASYSAFAAHLKSFNTTVGGVTAISPDNEPNYTVSYESMNMTATEIGNFVASYGTQCGASIMAPEPYNMDQTFINTYLSNASAKTNTSYVCGHIYGKTPYTFSPGKPVWMTEHYTNSSVSGNDWTNAMNAGKEIHDCMNAGWSAYVWWYIRRSYGLIDESSNITKLGYVMTQYARYIRPGYQKISCTANPTTNLYVTAYKSGSKIVIVAVNKNSSATLQAFTLSGATVSSFTPYVTSSSQNVAKGSNVTVSNGSFTVSFAASSVTTLVSN